MTAKLSVRHADAYHTCYALAGLSSAQNRSRFDAAAAPIPGPLECAFAWSYVEDLHGGDNGDGSKRICQEEDMVEPVHPIFVIPYAAVSQTRSYFSAKAGL